jgi:hypothetical protein
LEEVIVAFGFVTTGWASRVETRGAFVEMLAGWEEPEAELECEGSEFVMGSKCFGKGFPVDRFNHGTGPLESTVHIRFEQLEAVLSSDGKAEFPGDGLAANGELYFSGGEEWNVFAGERKLA